ncbi:tripartite motif-containing protein 16-like [Polypterus senegalus]|uniref:tripartite motif-containing protein 16-like n=1 Tax=Polypterus senegalus TaxID=55291 RepID=UPI0019661487|nr:tripartite motif-containing protein 16-like [Polypterus senegalus]
MTALLSAKQYCCSVCLDILKEPVSLTCGHNYCLDCINSYWDKSDEEGIYNCPQCNQTFNVRPEVKKNVMLKDLIAQLNTTNYAGPDDVSCDVCNRRKLRAVKTCLTCMASYCETHLQPHQQSEAFKRHNLEEPIRNLEEKLCMKHQKVLEIFCRLDETCICFMCAATNHKRHNSVTLEEERAEKQCQMQSRMEEIKIRIEEKEKKLEEMKETVIRIQSSAEREVQEHEEAFKSVLESIEKLRSEVIDVIRGQERREVRKAEKFMVQLEKDIEGLKIRGAEMAELLQTGDHIHFLKVFPSLCVPPKDEDIVISSDFLPETLKASLSDLKESLEEVSAWEFVNTSVFLFPSSVVNNPDYTLRNQRITAQLLEYSCSITLDPNSAHRCLCLSEENRKVTHVGTVTPYHDHPDRFDFLPHVLCREALSGTRYYWEVEWSGEWTEIGVMYKGIDRKGWSKECRLGFNNKSWSLCCSDFSYSAWHNNMKTEISAPYSHRIGVYLDCLAGSLSFYSISDIMNLLYRFKTTFTEPLYVGFAVGWDSSVTICL